MADVLCISVLIIKAALMRIEDDMTGRFKKSVKTADLVEVAESSAGLSQRSQSSSSVFRRKELDLKVEAEDNPRQSNAGKDQPVYTLGRRRTSLNAIRIPATRKGPIGMALRHTCEFRCESKHSGLLFSACSQFPEVLEGRLQARS